MNDYAKYSDLELLTLLREEKKLAEKAFNLLYFKYSAKIYGYCIYRASSREEADELMQDTWVKFYSAARNNKVTDSILPFLFTIARNISIDNFRKKNAQKHIDMNYFDTVDLERLAEPFHLEHDIDRKEFTKMVRIAVNSLDEIYKDTISLYWFGNFEVKEIAEISEETPACIRTRLSRAFSQLAKILKPYFIDIKAK